MKVKNPQVLLAAVLCSNPFMLSYANLLVGFLRPVETNSLFIPARRSGSHLDEPMESWVQTCHWSVRPFAELAGRRISCTTLVCSPKVRATRMSLFPNRSSDLFRAASTFSGPAISRITLRSTTVVSSISPATIQDWPQSCFFTQAAGPAGEVSQAGGALANLRNDSAHKHPRT